MVSKGFPNVITSGRQYNIGEKPSVILYTYINLHVVLSCFFVTMYCIVLLYSIKLTWRQCKVVFPAGSRNTNCVNCVLYLVYETTVSLYTS